MTLPVRELCEEHSGILVVLPVLAMLAALAAATRGQWLLPESMHHRIEQSHQSVSRGTRAGLSGASTS